MGDIIGKRLNKGKVGFLTAPEEEDTGEGSILAKATTRDFLDFGFEPEFIGRLPVRVSLDDLDENDLFNILKHSEGSILRQYRESFEGYDIEAAFSDGALRAVAARAIKDKTGARGLVTVLEDVLRDFKFHLPGTEVERLAVTEELINEPKAYLEKILANPDYCAEFLDEGRVREFESDFQREYGHRITFNDEAVEKAIRLARKQERPIKEFLSDQLSDYSYGLNIIAKKTGQKKFVITPAMLDDPVEELEKWIKNTLGE